MMASVTIAATAAALTAAPSTGTTLLFVDTTVLSDIDPRLALTMEQPIKGTASPGGKLISLWPDVHSLQN